MLIITAKNKLLDLFLHGVTTLLQVNGVITACYYVVIDFPLSVVRSNGSITTVYYCSNGFSTTHYLGLKQVVHYYLLQNRRTCRWTPQGGSKFSKRNGEQYLLVEIYPSNTVSVGVVVARVVVGL